MDPVKREQWLRVLKRADEKNPVKLQEPKKCHRVCSRHFSAGRPTAECTIPDQNLGHELPG
jgi:hypothetical protein